MAGIGQWLFDTQIGKGKVPVSALPKGGTSPMRHKSTWYLENWFDLPVAPK